MLFIFTFKSISILNFLPLFSFRLKIYIYSTFGKGGAKETTEIFCASYIYIVFILKVYTKILIKSK